MGATTTTRKSTLPLALLALLLASLFVALTFLGGEKGSIACVPPAAADDASEPASAPLTTAATRTAESAASEAATRAPTGAPETSEVAPLVAGVDGRVVDAWTREPVPALEVRLSCGKDAETVATDAQGEFRSSVRFESGDLTAVVADDGPEVARFTEHHDARTGTHGWLLEVPIGPTIPLAAIDGRTPWPMDWKARIVESTLPEGCAGVLTVTENAVNLVAPGDQHPDREWPWRRVRGDLTPWVRFAGMSYEPNEIYRAMVEVKSEAEGRKGHARIGTTRGILPLVSVATDRFVKLECRVEGIASSTAGDGARAGWKSERSARVFALPADIVPEPRALKSAPIWDETSDTGHGFVFPELVPGPKVIVAIVAGRRIGLKHVTLDEPAAELELDPGDTDSGPRDFWLGLAPANEELAAPVQLVRMRFSEVGAWAPAYLQATSASTQMHVQLPSLPGGAFDMRVIGLGGPPLWETDVRGRRLVDLDLPVTRANDVVSHGFEVRDAATRGELLNFDACFGPSGAMLADRVGAAGRRWMLSPKTPIAFSIWSRGYAPAFGDETSFVGFRRRRIARVELTPGLGALLFFRAGEPSSARSERDVLLHRGTLEALTAPPLPGVKVQGPFETALLSDWEGEVRVRLEEPASLRVECAGWQVRAVERIEQAGNRWIVWMKRKS